jgi:hypothetical protein
MSKCNLKRQHRRLGGFCEPNDQVHQLVDMFAPRAGSGTGNRPRLKTSGCLCAASQPAADGGGGMAAGAWRDYHGSVHAQLPFVHSNTNGVASPMELWRWQWCWWVLPQRGAQRGLEFRASSRCVCVGLRSL